MKELTNCLEIFPLQPRMRQGSESEYNLRHVVRKRQQSDMFVLLMKCDCVLVLSLFQ